MNTLSLTCVGHVLSITNSNVFASGSVSFDSVSFMLDENWDDYEVNALFYGNEREEPYEVPLDDGVALVPTEILAERGNVRVGIYGVYDETSRITSTLVKFKVREGAWHPDSTTGTTVDTLISQNNINQAVRDVAGSAADANAAALSAESARAAAASARSGAQSAQSAAEAARDAIKAFSVAAEAVAAGSSTPTVTKTVDQTTGAVTLTFGLVKGDKGDTGNTGATGATGNGISSISKTSTSGAVDTYTVTYTNGNTMTFTVTNGAVTSVAGKTGAVTLDAGDVEYDDSDTYDSGTVGQAVSALKSEIANKADYYLYTASGDVASFSDAIANSPISRIDVNLLYAQSGEGEPSLTNVRTITVPSLCTVNHSGADMSNPTEYEFDCSALASVGTLSYTGDGNWTYSPRYVLVDVAYNFFANATSITFDTTNNWVIIRNAFYSEGNGVTYRNRDRRTGGYFCISNVFSVVALNNTQRSSSQQRLYLVNSGGWTTSDGFLSDLSTYYNNGGQVQFLYEPTDELPQYTFTSDELFVLAGENNIWSDEGETSVTYRIDVMAHIAAIDADVTKLEKPPIDILTANDDAVNKILAARWLRSDTAKPLTLLWFSDIHRWQTPLNRIIEAKKYLNDIDVLDDAIVTGDLVRASVADGAHFTNFWNGTDGTDDILIALGNHDHYEQSTQPHGRASFDTLDSLFFSTVEDWGVTRQSNYPFYYKDYAEQGIRLIVADPFVKQTEVDQEAWLTATLEGARVSGLSVVVAAHYLLLNSTTETKSVTIYDNNWSNNLARETGTDTMDYESTDCDIVKCVTTFIGNGGSFLCYMIGHTHTDIVSYPTGHPEQLIINVACAPDDREHETRLTTNDLPRYENTRTQDCFNVITFDATNKIIKCVRVGANVNMYELPRTAFSYDVTNHTFISLV